MLPIEKGRIWMEWKCKKTREEGGGGGGRVKGQRGRKERGGGTHRLHRRIRVHMYAKGRTTMGAMVVARRGHTPAR